MACTIKNLEELLEIAQRPGMLEVTVKTNSNGAKLKLRGAHDLYTYKVADNKVVPKILQAFPSKLPVNYV
ncbi:hypothetical protein DASB73_002370 [Starmerella bacillaris]|uniref:Uncharacterized protein n=1 Tax=Starmerella bacillaris TaxID=1247836 RepID=A0AAV5RFD2_STABA|nr:hypothetical protein DASB73_002370 [Starmerella bacillaris]